MHKIVTVTCSRDLKQMILQSHSISKFIMVPVIHYVFVEDDSIPEKEWVKLLKPYYRGRHQLVIIYGHLPKDFLIGDGWSRQQVIKLEAFNIVKTEFITLDSKNFFIKPTKLQYTHEGTQSRIQYPDGVVPAIRGFVEFFANYSSTEIPMYMFNYCTPFIVKRNTIKTLLENYNIRELFEISLKAGHRPTEFLLYSMCANKELMSMTPDEWNEKFQPSISHTWWWDNEFNIITLANIDSSPVEIIGLHKNLWFYKNDKMKILSDWMVSKGLNRNIVNNATVDMDWGQTRLIGTFTNLLADG